MRGWFGQKPVWRRYIDEIMNEKRLIPTWPPGSPLNPGDLGTFKNGSFTGIGQTVAALGLPAPQVEIVDYKFDNEYQSRSGVDVALKTDVATWGVSIARERRRLPSRVQSHWWPGIQGSRLY